MLQHSFLPVSGLIYTKIPIYSQLITNKCPCQGLTRACSAHNAQLLSCLDGEIEPVQDNGCVLSVPHLIVLEGDGSTLWPVFWDFGILYVSWGLRFATLHKNMENFEETLATPLPISPRQIRMLCSNMAKKKKPGASQ